MQFPLLTSLALTALAATAARAQGNSPNPFSISGSLYFTAGTNTDISWQPTTSGTVTLILREGTSANLDPGVTIASNIPNNGKYTWNPSTSIHKGGDYALEIVSDSDPSMVNYSPFFYIDSPTQPTYTAKSTPSSVAPTGASSSGSSSSSATTTSSGSSSTSSGSSASKTSSSAASSSSATAAVTTKPTSSSTGAAAAATAALGGLLAAGVVGLLAL